jgi:hypothetical protein
VWQTTAIASVGGALLAAAVGCSASKNLGGNPDAGEGRLALADAADAGGQDALGGACASPRDCDVFFPGGFRSGPAVSCCIDRTCVYGQSAVDAVPCTDADVQLIQASNYDQSCQTDSDCVAVAEGNFCYAGAPNCPSAAISKSAYAQYQADVAKTNAAICEAASSCVAEFGPCCQNGVCQTYDCRFTAMVVGDAAADASAE